MDPELDLEKGTAHQEEKDKHESNRNSKLRIYNRNESYKEYENGKLVLGDHRHWTPDQGPHQVFVDIDIEKFDNINTVNQTFTAAFTVNQCWLWSAEDKEFYKSFIEGNQSSVKGNESHVDSTSNLKVSWQPKSLILRNAVKENLHVIEGKLRLKMFNRLVMIEKRTFVYGDFSEKFELDSFPFDCQDFRIEIDFFDSENICKISPNPLKRDFLSLNLHSMVQRAFKIHEPIVQMSMKRRKLVSEDLTSVIDYHPSMQICLKGKRFWMPYFYQIILMMVLMSSSSIFVFTLKLEEDGDRLGAITTMFLTKVAFQFALSTLLPRLSYLTILDKYIFACMVFSFSIMLQVAIVSWLASHSMLEVAISVDNILLLSNVLLLLIGNIIFAFYVYIRVLPEEKKKLISLEFLTSNTEDGSISDIHSETWNIRMTTEKMDLTDIIPNKILKLSRAGNSIRKHCEIGSWLAFKLPGRGHFAFFGESSIKSVLVNLYKKHLKENPPPENTTTPDDAQLDFLKNIHQLTGLWNLNLLHGVEFLSARVVLEAGCLEHGCPKVCFTKVTGDPEVPAGRISIKTEGLLVPESKSTIKGSRQLRNDIDGQDGFFWSDASIRMLTLDKIKVMDKYGIIEILRYATDDVSGNKDRPDILE